MESFFRTHKYLVEHVEMPVRRLLFDEISWKHRLIGIKGSRGVGKTTFLLEYAKQAFGTDKSCLYINLNNFYFTNHALIDFADEFCKKGGKTLLIDQVFKYPNWSKELRYIYDNYPELNIVFTGSSVMRLKEENSDLFNCVQSYNLRGFSFREYLNLTCKKEFRACTLDEIIRHHEQIAAEIIKEIKPLAYFQDYLHHGYYPFFLEKRNYSENLLKTINITLEFDVLHLKQIDLNYLPKLRKLLYLLTLNQAKAPNVSQLSTDIQTSRATVMNYIKYLQDARLLNLLYSEGESFPKKPEKIYLQNTNLIYAFKPNLNDADDRIVKETFFYNVLLKDHIVNAGKRNAQFLIDNTYNCYISAEKNNDDSETNDIYAVDMLEVGEGQKIPIWLFGFLY